MNFPTEQTQPDISLQQVVNLVIILRHGADYIATINQLTKTARFSTTSGCQIILKKLSAQVNPNDIVEGWLRGSARQFGLRAKAKAIWRQQKAAAEIQALVINVAPPGERPMAWDRRAQPPLPRTEDETYCILGLILTIPPGPLFGEEGVTQSGITVAQETLPKLGYLLNNQSVFYYYFGPTTNGVSLSEARRLFSQVQQNSGLE